LTYSGWTARVGLGQLFLSTPPQPGWRAREIDSSNRSRTGMIPNYKPDWAYLQNPTSIWSHKNPTRSHFGPVRSKDKAPVRSGSNPVRLWSGPTSTPVRSQSAPLPVPIRCFRSHTVSRQAWSGPFGPSRRLPTFPRADQFRNPSRDSLQNWPSGYHWTTQRLDVNYKKGLAKT
jgi:hypothetical protein